LLLITRKFHNAILKTEPGQYALTEKLYFHAYAGSDPVIWIKIEKKAAAVLNNHLINLSSFNPNLCR